MQQELEDRLLPAPVPAGPSCSHQPKEDEAAPFRGQINPMGEVLVFEGRVVSDPSDMSLASLCKRTNLRPSKRLVRAQDGSSTVLFKSPAIKAKFCTDTFNIFVLLAVLEPVCCPGLSQGSAMIARMVCSERKARGSSDAAQSRSSFCLSAKIIPERISVCPGTGAASCCLGKSPRDWDGEEGLSAAGAGAGRERLQGHRGEPVLAGGRREELPARISPAFKSRLHILCYETQP